MSDEASEGEPRGGEHQTEHGLYLVLLSLHGLIRGSEPELGRDADTGGQVLYVLDLARALAQHPAVERVDLVTRRVVDAKVSDDYQEREEDLGHGARIVRLDFGPRRYLRKEVLWPYIDVCVDQVLHHIRGLGRIPDIVHGHYADAGLAGAKLASLLGVPLVFTGHSLGREKQRRLLDAGMTQDKLESTYRISQRIEAEERALDAASAVIASTRQEVESQYALYDNHHPTRMTVIPPGVDLSRFQAPRRGEPDPPIAEEVNRFLHRPRKPMILALARPDERKNLHGLVAAYGGNPELVEKANLVVVAGNRDDVSDMERGPREVLTRLLLDIDRHDLYGSVAYPKHHTQDDVPTLYRLAAKRRGVFVNPAFTEPFGLTLVEAAASGVPIVATNDGGPRDIIRNLHNGTLVDPLDEDAMGEALLDAISDRRRWRRWSSNGVRNARKHYAWEAHVERYLKQVRQLLGRRRGPRQPQRSRLPTAERFLVCEIDEALLGEREPLDELLRRLDEAGERVALIAVSGRRLRGALEQLEEWGVPRPDALITSVGCEIHYARGRGTLLRDQVWLRHIDFRWQPERVREVLGEVPGLSLQPGPDQGPFKTSYFVDEDKAPGERELRRLLRREGLQVSLQLSHDMFLDVVPIRASKGQALRYMALRWGLPLERFLVAGAAGSDLDMLAGDTLAVVVQGADRQLQRLKGSPRVHFAEAPFAGGVLEGLDHYRFLDPDVDPARIVAAARGDKEVGTEDGGAVEGEEEEVDAGAA